MSIAHRIAGVAAVLMVCALSALGVQPEASKVDAARAEAKAIIERARELYEKCTTFRVNIECARGTQREGEAKETEVVYWTSAVEFVRPGMIRVEDQFETNGANARVAWGGSKKTKEIVEAESLAPEAMGEWMREQVWLPSPWNSVLQTVLGGNGAEFLAPEFEEVTEVRSESLAGAAMRVVIGRGARIGWKQKTGSVEARMYFGQEDGLLHEIAFEDAAFQRLQDQYKTEKGTAPPAKIVQASDHVRFRNQVIGDPIEAGRFEPPAGYKRVVLPSSPMGPSVLTAIGKQALDPEMAEQLGGKPTAIMTYFMGAGVEYFPSMEHLHQHIQPRAQVMSTRPRPETGLTYDVQRITHPAIEFWGSVAGVSTQQFAPMLFLIDGKNRLQAVFTGYMPVYALRLEELAQKLTRGEALWSDEVMGTWARGEVAEEK